MISKDLGLGERYIRLVARSASHRYKVYQITKKTGGSRTIHHPAKELKLLQVWLVEKLLSKLPVHPSAAAYRPGCSVKRHANVHRHNKFMMKVDMRDFFPSITGKDVVHVLKKRLGSRSSLLSSSHDFDIIRKLTCRNDQLTIGAPSSPLISNAVMYDFDVEWAARCAKGGIAYTRYADDLYFSTNRPNILAPLLVALRADLRQRKSPVLQINDQKTVFTSRKRRRLITGVVITPQGDLSLGRKRKRYIRSLFFRLSQGKLSAEQRNYLRGFISYAKSVEPSFIASIERKYGAEVLAAGTTGTQNETLPNY